MHRKLFLTFPEQVMNEPLIYNLSRDFDVVFNIQGASITQHHRMMAIVLEGEEGSVEKAVAYLTDRGVKVEVARDDADLGTP